VETEIDKIIDFPKTYFDVEDEEIKEAVEYVYKREPAVDLRYYKKWLKTHDQWRNLLLVFLYIVLKKFGENYFKGAILHILLDSFAPRLSKVGQADILTFKAIIDYYRNELTRYFDDRLFDDVLRSVEKHLDEILDDIAKQHKIVYRDIQPEDIVQIEIYYDSRTVNEDNLEFIKQAVEELKQKYGIKIIEKQIDKMSKVEIEKLVGRMNVICMLLKISARISRKYTLGKELTTFSPEYPFVYYIRDNSGEYNQKDSIILFVKYKDKEIFYPHTPSKEMRVEQWVYPTDFIEYMVGKISNKC
jgi:hypothetical protein